ncbi:MAG TPA: SDR family oxidoreductase [Verrucomicrobiales bacterium]|nr:SDR family oxidoreductase [Verrucomicrobiales bacterium]
MSEQKAVWITGVSRGLGRALAEGFRERGWVVAGCARSAETIEELRKCFGSHHYFGAADVAVEEAVEEFVREAQARTGSPDLLLNNAALINASAPLWEVAAVEFDRVIDTNVKGVVNVLRHTIPLMMAAGRGIIVNFSSGWGRSASAEVAPYCASKWAIEGLTAALAQELPEGLAAAALNPGVIDTDMLRSCFGGSASAYPRPTDWARRAVPYLISLDAQCNGRALTAPG